MTSLSTAPASRAFSCALATTTGSFPFLLRGGSAFPGSLTCGDWLPVWIVPAVRFPMVLSADRAGRLRRCFGAWFPVAVILAFVLALTLAFH